jgi:hypothetical protein
MTDVISMTREELEQLVRNVMEMNYRDAGEIRFLDQTGAAIDFSIVMVACTGKAITVFPPMPTETPEEMVRRFSRAPTNPKEVAPPASMEELQAMVGQ